MRIQNQGLMMYHVQSGGYSFEWEWIVLKREKWLASVGSINGAGSESSAEFVQWYRTHVLCNQAVLKYILDR